MSIQKISVDQLDKILDLVLWAELESLSVDDLEDKAWIVKKLNRMEYSGCEFFGYFCDDKLIGFATILIEDRPAKACDGYGACELLQLGFKEEYRNKGYGSEMLQHIEAYLQTQKVYCMYMHTYASDYSVVAFYGKNGYIPRGLVPDVYGPNLDGMLYMSKPLNSAKAKQNP
ncbi:MAG: GNAT family N-acetyltransferase [Oscillospiraceae bacterium]